MFDKPLDRRIRIERNTPVQDEYGQPIDNWSEFATIKATWRRASAKETLASSEVSATASDIFEIRWSRNRSTIGPLDRIVYEGRIIYDIQSATEMGRRIGIRIGALARTDHVDSG